MHSALTQFTENLKRVKELGALATAIESMTTPAVDVSDMLRSQIVLAVSALDQFVHELVRVGMVEAAKGRRRKTDAYMRFPIPVTAVESALNGLDCETWVGESVRERHSWMSFQDPERIAEVLRLISNVKLWEEVGRQLGMTGQDVKTRLKLVVDRRHKIAHEADIDPANPGFRWTIDAAIVKETIEFIEKVGAAMFKLTK